MRPLSAPSHAQALCDAILIFAHSVLFHFYGDCGPDQEILRANASVKVAADLATKYRKNVQYNLEATKQEYKS